MSTSCFKLACATATAVLLSAFLSAVASAQLKEGQAAPDFTVTTQNGPLKLSSFAGKKSVVLVFDRAHW